MYSLSAVTTASLVILTMTSAWYDVRERRVPNALTIGGLLLALALGAVQGWSGLGEAAAGAGLALAVALPVFMAGGLGGGDVKLLAAVGAFLGLSKLPVALVAVAVIGGVMALVEIVRQGAARRTVHNLYLIVSGMSGETFSRWRGRGNGEALTVDAPEAVTVPYAVAIALGALVAQGLV